MNYRNSLQENIILIRICIKLISNSMPNIWSLATKLPIMALILSGLTASILQIEPLASKIYLYHFFIFKTLL